jgi:hypothetical protein
MLPSLRSTIERLSKLQREFLIDHVDGIRPFADAPVENATRGALLARKFICYEPPQRNRLGRPVGTVLTDTGREALSFILGDMADNLTRALLANERCLDENRECALFHVLTETAKHWRLQDVVQQRLGVSTNGEANDNG